MRFLGNIEAKIDAKGRVFLPATFRKVLQANGENMLVLRKDVHEACLVLYPLSVWDRRTEEILERVNEYNKEDQMVFRQYVSAVEEVTLDVNGRFLIPKRYLQMAEIKQSVRMIGIKDYIEIWAAEKTEDPFLSEDDFSSKLNNLMAKK